MQTADDVLEYLRDQIPVLTHDIGAICADVLAGECDGKEQHMEALAKVIRLKTVEHLIENLEPLIQRKPKGKGRGK